MEKVNRSESSGPGARPGLSRLKRGRRRGEGERSRAKETQHSKTNLLAVAVSVSVVFNMGKHATSV